jgi:2-polyprenyl-3-methyl-5-hydroxy-6-metoxy-1,4-benzoquinol methylase
VAGADTQLREVVRQYLRGGDLLILGCGGSSVLEGLEAEGLKSALGIDLSDEAIRLASRYASPKISFQKANMLEFQCPQAYDVILFSESLNYAPVAGRKALLERLANHLKPEGVLVVTLAQAERYRDIIELIRDNFKIITDCKFSGSSRHLLVFRG